MAEIPAEAVQAAMRALQAHFEGCESPDYLCCTVAAVEAAAPFIAERIARTIETTHAEHLANHRAVGFRCDAADEHDCHESAAGIVARMDAEIARRAFAGECSTPVPVQAAPEGPQGERAAGVGIALSGSAEPSVETLSDAERP